MQIAALRSANALKLSSNSSISEEYWLTSTSAGTPSGYCCSQKRFTIFPPCRKAALAVSFDFHPLPEQPNAAWTDRTHVKQHNQARRLSAPHLATKHQP